MSKIQAPTDIVASLLNGAIDMHVHTGPDAYVPRRSDAIDIAIAAKQAGLRGFVLKNKGSGTGMVSAIVRKVVPEVMAIGSLTLDRHVGGINPTAVETEARLGSRVVWMPTHDAANELNTKGINKEGLRVIDERGNLIPDVDAIFAIALEYDLVIATGHISREEVFALVREGTRRKVKLIVSHPLTRSVGTYLPIEDQKELAKMGAIIEHCFVATMPNHDRVSLAELTEAITEVGPNACIVSSDFGQYHNPPPIEGIRMAIASLLRCGFSEEQVTTMVRRNPERLLGI